MATTRPRITISLEPRQRELLGRLAKANRVPMSRTVVDLLEAVEPYLERAATLVERASQLRGKGIGRELVASLERAEQDVRPHIEAGLKHVDQAVADAEARAGSGRAHAQRATAPTLSTPVRSNHGGQVDSGRSRKAIKVPGRPGPSRRRAA